MNYTLNNYRVRRISNKYFITTDHGSFCILSEQEFNNFKRNEIDPALKNKLLEKEIIIDENNLQEVIRLSSNRKSFLFQGTSLHIIVVTLRCNMNCIYCHASSKPCEMIEFDMDKETAKKTVDFIFQTPSKSVSIEFQGGEPLLNWNIIEFIVQYAQDKNLSVGKDLKISVVTNLSLMDEQKMHFLIEHDVAVCTSLDGPKYLHDFNRKSSSHSNYDDVIKWINNFSREYRERKSEGRINALVTLTKKSMICPEEIVDEYVKLGLKDIHLRFLNNLGVASKVWNTINYNVDEYLDFWKKAVAYIDKLNEGGILIKERIVDLMVNKIQNEFDPNYLDLRSPCGAVIGQLVYDYNGNIYTCDEARMLADDDLFLLGNVKTDNYKDIVTCDKAFAVINASINDQYICDNCVYKPYCGICPVCNYAEQGSVIGKISQTDRCKIFKEQFDWVVREKFINENNTN